jgi:hypothetical protein
MNREGANATGANTADGISVITAAEADADAPAGLTCAGFAGVITVVTGAAAFVADVAAAEAFVVASFGLTAADESAA